MRMILLGAQPDNQAAQNPRRLRGLLLVPVILYATAPVADDHWLGRPGAGLSQDRGWLVEPGFSSQPEPGLYHEVWPSSLGGTQAEADRYTGVRHRFQSGLGLDTGIARYGLGTVASSYQEYYLGLNYDVWQGRVWYTNDYQGSGLDRSY
jgi:hypothetical protein